MTPAEQAVWMAQWRAAGPALANVHHRELRALSDADALRATEALLSLAADTPLPPERRRYSGLVEQQALLHGRKR